MELEEIYERIDAVGEQELKANKIAREGQPQEMVMTEEVTETASSQPVDIYNQQQLRQSKTRDKRERHGSDPIVNIAVDSVLQTITPHYRKAKGMVKHLKEVGQDDKAEAIRNQYMMDYYLPGVEAVIAQSSPDDLLNNEKAMQDLEQYSLTLGDVKGYLRGYLMSAYGTMLGRVQSGSDDTVATAVRQLMRMGAEGEIRAAISLAKRLQKDIDSGRNVASEADYETILKVANA